MRHAWLSVFLVLAGCAGSGSRNDNLPFSAAYEASDEEAEVLLVLDNTVPSDDGSQGAIGYADDTDVFIWPVHDLRYNGRDVSFRIPDEETGEEIRFRGVDDQDGLEGDWTFVGGTGTTRATPGLPTDFGKTPEPVYQNLLGRYEGELIGRRGDTTGRYKTIVIVKKIDETATQWTQKAKVEGRLVLIKGTQREEYTIDGSLLYSRVVGAAMPGQRDLSFFLKTDAPGMLMFDGGAARITKK
jgi:hypothetical protein